MGPVTRVVYLLTRVWFLSCRLTGTGKEQIQSAVADGPVIGVFWHYSFAFILHLVRGNSAAVMVSASRDGEYIARIARLYAYVPVRGSSNRLGASALRGLIRQLRKGRHAALVGDGSQGPARKLQAGVVLLAAKTGAPILPMTWAAKRYLTFNSWDRTVLPLPFTRVHFIMGEPVYVPADSGKETLELYRQQVEEALNSLYAKAWAAVGQGPHDRTGEQRP